jgi:hypothetical protein
LRRLGRGFFRNVVDSFTIALVLSGGGASLSPGLLDVIVGVGLVVSRRVLGLSDLRFLDEWGILPLHSNRQSRKKCRRGPMAAVDTFGHVWLSAVGAVTPALMVAVGLYQEASFSFVDVGCFSSSSEGQALSMQF